MERVLEAKRTSLRWAMSTACPHSTVTLMTKTYLTDCPPWRCSPLKHWGSKQEKTQTNRIKQISWNRLFVVVADKDHRTIGVWSGGGGNLGNPSGDLVRPELFCSQGTLIFLILRGLTLVPCILTCADTWQLSILPQSLTNSCSVWLTGAFYWFFWWTWQRCRK